MSKMEHDNAPILWRMRPDNFINPDFELHCYTRINKEESSKPASTESTHHPIIIISCELFILGLAGHKTTVDEASGATILWCGLV